jgi:perosamine synthetase
MQSDVGMGGSAGRIPLCVPEIRGNEWNYIKECLDSTFVSYVGPFVTRFENELAQRVGVRYGVATVSGTPALHIALLVTGVRPDEEVLVSTLTFIAPVNAIRYSGAWPVFMDAEPDYWQMDTEKVADFLHKECNWRDGALYNRLTNRRIKAILPVHILGHPVDMNPILELARKYDLVVIEDATESLGATYRGQPVGHLGDISCFSFNGNKLMTTGGGGMIATDNQRWAERAKYLTTQAKDDAVEFIHGAIGYNYRLTNIQAAMGCAQLELLDDFIKAKLNIASNYKDALSDVDGITPMREANWARSVFWLYTVLVDATRFGIDSRALLSRFEEAGIQTRPLWQPMHRSPPHRGAQSYHCEVADRLNRDALSLPCSVGLTAEQQARVLGVIKESCLESRGLAAAGSGF